MRILIVDDNRENLYLLEVLLQGNGYEVVSAANGAEALEKLRAERFDMIITDIFMPVMDGFQLRREVKGDDELKDIPFVFYTATYTDEEDEEFALELGADKFIRKPAEPDEFMKIIRGVIEDAETGKIARKKPVLEEEEVFKLYSERLVKKLEKKMLDLEREITERKRAEEEVKKHRDHLEGLVEERTAELTRANEQLEQEITERKRANDLMRAQYDLSLALSTVPGLDETLHLCLEAAIRVSGMDCGGVYLVDQASGSVDLVLHRGLPLDFVRSASHYDADSASARLVMAGKPIYARHRELGVSLNEARRREALRAVAVVPVRHEGRVVACLNIASHTLDEVPDSARTALETMASQIGSAVARAKMEEALRESEERFRELAELLPQTIYETDERGNLIFANRRAFEVFGYDREDFEGGLNVLQVLISKDRDRATENIGRVLGGEDLGGVEYTAQRKDGTTFPVVTYTNAIIRRGKLVGLRGIVIDITERKRAEEALRESEERLRAIFAENPDCTYLTDTEGNILDVNPVLLELVGLSLEQMQEKNALDFFAGDDPEELLQAAARLRAGEKVRGLVVQARLAGGELRDYEVHAIPLKESGVVTVFLNVARDITERKRMEEERQRLYEQARRDAETKATLLQEVNHRVKNNLTAIIGLLHVEQSYAKMSDQAAYEAMMQSLTTRISGLATVHGLLTASEWAPLLLSDLAGQVIKSAIQMRPRDKQVFIDAPPSPVHVAPDQAHNLALVINELATNTIQHTLPGRNEAHISVRIALEDDVVLFEYRDDGPGYPEDVLKLERHAVGFDLIKNLTRRSLRGELSLHNDEGAVAVIRFPAQA